MGDRKQENKLFSLLDLYDGERTKWYGRLHAYVFVDRVNFNLELVKQGFNIPNTDWSRSMTKISEMQNFKRETTS